MTKVEQLERRVAKLEAASSALVHGWDAAAKVLGIHRNTLARIWRHEPKRIAKPVRVNRDGRSSLGRPVWRRNDLIEAYTRN